jgi:hypothetical protein
MILLRIIAASRSKEGGRLVCDEASVIQLLLEPPFHTWQGIVRIRDV